MTSITWKENELNMVDTPGHADFGGEVCLFIDFLYSILLPVKLKLGYKIIST